MNKPFFALQTKTRPGNVTHIFGVSPLQTPLTCSTQCKQTCMLIAMPSRSDRSSDRFLVPRTFLSVVWASRRVEKSALTTLATDAMGSLTRKYTTPSTETVTESLVRIWGRKASQFLNEKRHSKTRIRRTATWVLTRFYLLGRDVKGHRSQVNFHKGIGARQDEENSYRVTGGEKQKFHMGAKKTCLMILIFKGWCLNHD